MGFENSIFISYAHVDNQPRPTEQTGWIEALHENLAWRLQQLLGKKIAAPIWRDKKLQGNDEFDQEIIRQLERAAILVPVLSPSYVTSDWCLRELSHFCDYTQRAAGLQCGGQSRIFKVIKTHLPHHQHPEPLPTMLGYKFYEIVDEAQGRTREFLPTERDSKYWEKLEDLAHNIKSLIEGLANGDQLQSSVRKDAVYLALTTSDLDEERDKIKRELQQNGFTVLPDQVPPLTAAGFQQAVRAYLERSRLAVHLIGKHYGIVPEGESRSHVQLQHDLALEHKDSGDFARLVWLPIALEPADDRQRQFIEQLQNTTHPLKGWELLQTKLEDLKTLIQTRLRQPQSTPSPTATDQSPLLYLICDQQDDEVAGTLDQYLFDQGLEILRLTREGDQEHLAHMHRECLRLSDAALVFCQQSSDSWLQMKRLELMKLPGIGRERPPLVKPLYLLSGQPTKAKEQFRTHEGEVFRMFDGLDFSLLAPFIARLKTAKGGQQ